MFNCIILIKYNQFVKVDFIAGYPNSYNPQNVNANHLNGIYIVQVYMNV